MKEFDGSGLLDVLMYVFIAIGALAGVYAAYLGFLMGTATDESKRKAAKDRILKVLSSVMCIIVLSVILGTVRFQLSTVEGEKDNGDDGGFSEGEMTDGGTMTIHETFNSTAQGGKYYYSAADVKLVAKYRDENKNVIVVPQKDIKDYRIKNPGDYFRADTWWTDELKFNERATTDRIASFPSSVTVVATVKSGAKVTVNGKEITPKTSIDIVIIIKVQWLNGEGQEFSTFPALGTKDLNRLGRALNEMVGKNPATGGDNSGECVDLVKAYLKAYFGWPGGQLGDGKVTYDGVCRTCDKYFRRYQSYTNSAGYGKTNPQIGDVVSFAALNTNDPGHVAIVMAVNTSNKTITVLEQNIVKNPKRVISSRVYNYETEKFLTSGGLDRPISGIAQIRTDKWVG
ncbi:MAG: CHAP domain-containing protein [Christensenellaceae bacterium]|jgi:hypothetical protein|nr:CHAP domain-containing protein [Christensenellaceae bacterium]